MSLSSAQKKAMPFGQRLAKLFERVVPEDEGTRAVLDRMDHAQRRIEEVREEVKRGVRRSEGRFRL